MTSIYSKWRRFKLTIEESFNLAMKFHEFMVYLSSYSHPLQDARFKKMQAGIIWDYFNQYINYRDLVLKGTEEFLKERQNGTPYIVNKKR